MQKTRITFIRNDNDKMNVHIQSGGAAAFSKCEYARQHVRGTCINDVSRKFGIDGTATGCNRALTTFSITHTRTA